MCVSSILDLRSFVASLEFGVWSLEFGESSIFKKVSKFGVWRRVIVLLGFGFVEAVV